jgi:Ca2+-binding RTX toxin-like protein
VGAERWLSPERSNGPSGPSAPFRCTDHRSTIAPGRGRRRQPASIWIFQEGVKVAATNLAGGTGINGGGFDGSIVKIEGSVDAATFLLNNFGNNASIEVTETGRLGETDAGIIGLFHGTGNHLTNDGIIDAGQVLFGPDGVLFNNGVINAGLIGTFIVGEGSAELLSNNGTINSNVQNFRHVVNDGTINPTGLVPGVFGAFGQDTTVINNGVIGNDVQLHDGNDLYDGSGGGQVTGKVTGGKGDDSLTGGPAGDRMDGEGDDDLLNGRGGDDSLQGGGGNDTLNGGFDDDRLSGEAGDDRLSGGEGDDDIDGGRGDDAASGNAGNDSIDGGEGDDTLLGDVGSDTIKGGEDNDRLNGVGGPDELFGGEGNDNIIGGAGNDSLRAGAGQDTLVGGPGFDFVRGGGGGDLFEFRVGSNVDVLEDFADDTDEINLLNERPSPEGAATDR